MGFKKIKLILNSFYLFCLLCRHQDENRYHEDIFGVTLRTYEVTNRIRSESIAYIEENKKDSDEWVISSFVSSVASEIGAHNDQKGLIYLELHKRSCNLNHFVSVDVGIKDSFWSLRLMESICATAHIYFCVKCQSFPNKVVYLSSALSHTPAELC